ncbi:MAG: SGNH/GDSL hydrolase family protein, partial [Planctomycetota bacterium]
LGGPPRGPAAEKVETPYWADAMAKVHARFRGEKGTFAHFGDSITVSMAFWASLRWHRKNMSPEAEKDYELVRSHMKPECWGEWKGPEYGNAGSMTIRWAHENVGAWLRKLNPETALILFGTNDLGALELEEYKAKTKEVVRRCLANGTVVILTTIPPKSGQLEKARAFAEAVAEIGRELEVPVIDYFGEILKRRPDDWDGTLEKFRGAPGDEYQVPTLVSRDGVHPSNPAKYDGDYSEEGLRASGYVLRNYLTLRAYAEVIRRVLRPEASKG